MMNVLTVLPAISKLGASIVLDIIAWSIVFTSGTEKGEAGQESKSYFDRDHCEMKDYETMSKQY